MRRLVLTLCFAFPAQAQPLTMAAFGDSISQGYNAVNQGVNLDVNWATGRDIKSHRVRLTEQGHEVNVLNVSQVGAQSRDLDDQFLALGDQVPGYVTVEIGANDVCRGFVPGTPDHVDALVAKLVARNPDVKIVLAPIPRLLSVYEANADQYGCRLIWDLFHVCPAVLARDLTDNDRAAAQQRIDQLNDQLGRVADQHPQVRFNRAAGDHPFDKADLGTIDCFHPSTQGQGLISQLTF
jgi:lysophospholipase L1-like esterase